MIKHFVTAVFCSVIAVPALTAQPPNIVLIMADDLGIDSVEDYKTIQDSRYEPVNKQGMRFTHAMLSRYAPNTRIQLMTVLTIIGNWVAFGILDPQAKTLDTHAGGWI